MSDATSQVIDLNKLSEREMLILVYRKVESLEKTTESQTTKQAQTDIQLAILKNPLVSCLQNDLYSQIWERNQLLF